MVVTPQRKGRRVIGFHFDIAQDDQIPLVLPEASPVATTLEHPWRSAPCVRPWTLAAIQAACCALPALAAGCARGRLRRRQQGEGL